MPGAARMYPETDIPVISISREVLEGIRLPELLDEKVLRYEKEYGLSVELARLLVSEDVPFERFVTKYPSLDPGLLVQTLINTPKEMHTRFGVSTERLQEEDFDFVFSLLEKKKISKEALFDILLARAKGEDVRVETYAVLDEKEVTSILKDVMKENKDASLNALMGEAMKKLRGKVDGKRVLELLKELGV